MGDVPWLSHQGKNPTLSFLDRAAVTKPHVVSGLAERDRHDMA